MSTITETQADELTQAEEQLPAAERELGQAYRYGRSVDQAAQQVEDAQKNLDRVKARQERAAILARIREREQQAAEDAVKAHGAAVKANGAALKRERAQLADSAQEAAQSVLEAVSAVRDAVTRLRLHTASLTAAAGRLEALGLNLRDDYGNTYDTGASVERGKAAVRFGEGGVFGSLDAREVQGIVRWIFAQVDSTEFHGRDSGAAHLHGVDSQIRERLTPRN